MEEKHLAEDEVLLCLAICAQDGILSSSELELIESYFNEKHGITSAEFENTIDRFFEENETIEEIFRKVDDPAEILEVALRAAAADGLELRESFAYEKCLKMLESENSRVT